MPNSWSKQVYMQVFDCESIIFKNSVNMYEHMEIAESIDECVVEPSYKKTNRVDANRSDHRSLKRVE